MITAAHVRAAAKARVNDSNLNCVSAWNIDPSGGVTGVQF